MPPGERIMSSAGIADTRHSPGCSAFDANAPSSPGVSSVGTDSVAPRSPPRFSSTIVNLPGGGAAPFSRSTPRSAPGASMRSVTVSFFATLPLATPHLGCSALTRSSSACSTSTLRTPSLSVRPQATGISIGPSPRAWA